jgi:hypothetical protein
MVRFVVCLEHRCNVVGYFHGGPLRVRSLQIAARCLVLARSHARVNRMTLGLRPTQRGQLQVDPISGAGDHARGDAIICIPAFRPAKATTDISERSATLEAAVEIDVFGRI